MAPETGNGGVHLPRYLWLHLHPLVDCLWAAFQVGDILSRILPGQVTGEFTIVGTTFALRAGILVVTTLRAQKQVLGIQQTQAGQCPHFSAACDSSSIFP
jgi:hypothetical protein